MMSAAMRVTVFILFIGGVAQADDGHFETQFLARQRVVEIEFDAVIADRIDPGAQRLAVLVGDLQFDAHFQRDGGGKIFLRDFTKASGSIVP